ncbi:MAG: hypothetical protein GY765_38695 [bacterium]|nr:hypothetical protein [bacterium]
MKKVIIFMLLSTGLMLFPAGSELGHNNLKGIKHLIVSAEFNGITVGEEFRDKTEEEAKEYNVEEAEEGLKEVDVPLTRKDILAIFHHVRDMIGESDLEILKMGRLRAKSTIIPTLTLRVDTLAAAADTYFAVVHLTLSKRVSNWVGSKRIQAPVYTWSQKALVAVARENGVTMSVDNSVREVPAEEEKAAGDKLDEENATVEDSTAVANSPAEQLLHAVSSSATRLTELFISEYIDANTDAPPEEEIKEGKEEAVQKKKKGKKIRKGKRRTSAG